MEVMNLSLVEFIKNPTSKTYIACLNEISDGRAIMETANRSLLERAAEKEIEFSHDDYEEFEKDLVSIVGRLSLTTDWQAIEERLDQIYCVKDSEDEPTLSEDQKQTIRHLLTTTKDEIQEANLRASKILEGRDQEKDQLKFFRVINKNVFEEVSNEAGLDSLGRREIVDLVEGSRKLQKYLLSLCVDEDYRSPFGQRRESLDSEHSYWFFACLLQIHHSFLKKYFSDTSEETAVSAADHAFYHLMSIGYLCVAQKYLGLLDQKLPQDLTNNIVFFDSPLKHEFKETQSQFQVAYLLGNAAEASDYKHRDDFVMGFAMLTNMAVFQSKCAGLIKEEFWEFLRQSWLDKDWNHHNDWSVLVQCPVINYALEVKRFGLDDDFYKELISADFDADILCREMNKRLESRMKESSKAHYLIYLASNVRDFEECEFGVDWVLEGFVLPWLVKNTKKILETEGKPMDIPFFKNLVEATLEEYDDGSIGYIKKSPQYFKSISTLAINLALTEEYSNFGDEERFDCYLTAATEIAGCGYQEHSAIFLSYAILNGYMGWKGIRFEIVPRKLQKFIDEHVGEYYSKKYISLALKIILEGGVELSPGEELWISSFVERYRPPSAKVIPIFQKADVGESLVPRWFEFDAREIEPHLVCMKNAFDDFKIHKTWWRSANKYRVSGAFTHLLQSFEGFVRSSFQDIHQHYYANNAFQNAYQKFIEGTRHKLNKANTCNIGWVVYFLKPIVEMPPTTTNEKKFDSLCIAADSAMPGMGHTLKAFRNNEPVYRSFARTNEYDNVFSHSRTVRNPYGVESFAEVSQLQPKISYADAQWLYDYLTVSLGDLFDIVQVGR